MTSHTDRTTATRASRRAWFGLAVMMVPIFMMATDITVLFLALPEVTADLVPSGTQMLWMLHISEFMAVGLVLTMGQLADRFGRRLVLTVGVAVYGAASLAAALSTSSGMLIGFRALLGIAAATMMPSIMGLLRSMFPDPKQFSLAIAVNLSAFSAGSALGPPLGGLLLEHFWWGSVFLANVPAALLLLATVWLLPRGRDGATGRIDLISVVLSLVAILAIVFGLQEIAAGGGGGGASSLPYFGVAVAGLLVGALFVRRQLRLADPLVDLRLLKVRAFVVPLALVLLVLLALVGSDMLFVQHLQVVMGLSAGQAGLWLVIPAVASVIGTMLAPALARWMRPAYAMAGGLLLSAASALLIVTTARTAGVLFLIVAVSLLALGAGPTLALAANLMLTSAPPERAGSAAAMNDVSAGFGQGIGLALLGSLAVVVYRGSLSVPDALPSEAADAAADSAGGAQAVAGQLPGEIGQELLAAAQSAFGTAVQAAYAVAGAVLLLAAVITLWRLRRSRLADGASGSDVPEPAVAQRTAAVGG